MTTISGATADLEMATAVTMAEAIVAHDWSATPLGPRERWSETLRTAVDIMLGSGHAMCLVWGPGQTLLYNDSYAPFLGKRHPAALGLAFAEVWSDVWQEIGPLTARAFAGETITFQNMPLTMTRNGYDEETWWTFSYSPVRGPDGAVAGMLNVASDTTPRMLAERERASLQTELRDRERFLSNVLVASTDCIKVLELDGSLSMMSEGGMAVMEISDFNDVKGCPWPDFLKDGGVGLARDAIDAAREGRSSHFETAADTFIGTPKYWSVSVSPIFGDDGEIAQILSVSRDHTALEQARQQQKLLNGELNHRLKNMLAMVQSIANQTIGKAASLEDASSALSSRLVSLGHATDVLTASSWEAADLHAVVEAGLQAIGGLRDRVNVSGPILKLNAQAGLALTLALHELATNALKYGALSGTTGTVDLTWQLSESSESPRLLLAWRERGGPAVTVPERRGFGSRLIERSLASYFRGDVALRFPPEGVHFSIDAPLIGVVDDTGA